jgi:hypothetical protein
VAAEKSSNNVTVSYKQGKLWRDRVNTARQPRRSGISPEFRQIDEMQVKWEWGEMDEKPPL